MTDYPEHAKLRAVADESQAIGEFLDMGGYVLCERRPAGNNGEPEYIWTKSYLRRHENLTRGHTPDLRDYISGRAVCNPAWEAWHAELVPVAKSIPELLAEWFEIDLDAIEREKRAMLEAIRGEA